MKIEDIKFIIQTTIMAFIAIGVLFGVKDDIFIHRNRSAIENTRDAELKYMKCLSELTEEVQSYIDKCAPSSNLHALNLIEECEKYQVDVKFVLAQGKKESNFGVNGKAAKTNSVWNVGAFDGLSTEQIHQRYKYDHPNESIEPYLKLLKSRYLKTKTEQDLLLGFTDEHGTRYATDSTYESDLRTIYNQISNTTKIDSIQMMLRHYKVESGK